MVDIPTGAFRSVSDVLDSLRIDYAFVGGSIVGLLLDHPGVMPMRPTDDMDIIIEVMTRREYTDLEKQLRLLGFEHDTSQGAPICRWLYRNLILDIMPIKGEFIGLNTKPFRAALDNAMTVTYAQTKLRILSASGFLATKYFAFKDRGQNDFQASHDIEDMITVIDGKQHIVSEIKTAVDPLRKWVVEAFKEFAKRGCKKFCVSLIWAYNGETKLYAHET
jgi:predicted nucleotidyltransferase